MSQKLNHSATRHNAPYSVIGQLIKIDPLCYCILLLYALAILAHFWDCAKKWWVFVLINLFSPNQNYRYTMKIPKSKTIFLYSQLDITCSIWGCVAAPFSLSIYSVLFPIKKIAWVQTSNLGSCSVYNWNTLTFCMHILTVALIVSRLCEHWHMFFWDLIQWTWCLVCSWSECLRWNVYTRPDGTHTLTLYIQVCCLSCIRYGWVFKLIFHF